jgi:hypothetical protein
MFFLIEEKRQTSLFGALPMDIIIKLYGHCIEGAPCDKNTCPTRFLSCGHIYHAHCIDKWLKRRSVCPLCNRPPVVDPDHTDTSVRDSCVALSAVLEVDRPYKRVKQRKEDLWSVRAAIMYALKHAKAGFEFQELVWQTQNALPQRCVEDDIFEAALKKCIDDEFIQLNSAGRYVYVP